MSKHSQCPEHIEIDLHGQCSFNCVYCISNSGYNSGKIQTFDKKKFLEEIEIDSNFDKAYYLSPWTDVYQDNGDSYQQIRFILSELSMKGLPFFIITKSPAVLRDVEYFLNRENAFIAISLNTLNHQISRKLEPQAPSSEKRMELIEELVSIKGLKTVVKIDPIIPGLTDTDQLEEISDWLCRLKPSAVTAETLRLSIDIASALQGVMEPDDYSRMISRYPDLNDTIQLPNLSYRMEMFGKLFDKFSHNSVKLSFCRATLPIQISPFDCRGGFD